MADEQQEGQFTGGYYVGKEFVKKGIKKDKDGEEKEWTLYRVSFKKKMEDQYTFKGSAFNNVVDQLEDGEYYNIGYNLSEPKYNEKAKKEVQYKSIFYVKKAVPGSVNESSSKEKPSVSKEEISAFYDQYIQIEIENDSREKCMLCYFMNKYEKEYDLLHEHIKDKYND